MRGSIKCLSRWLPIEGTVSLCTLKIESPPPKDMTLKNGRYYAVLNYRNAGGQRKTKWISLGLPEKGNKRKAEAELARLRAEFEPPKEVGDLSSDMLFADYLLE